MSLKGALNAAVSSLRVNQASIQVLSANIAHVNDPNYTRKTLNRESLVLGDTQVGSVGIASYSSAVSESLRKQMESLIARNGTSNAQDEFMSVSIPPWSALIMQRQSVPADPNLHDWVRRRPLGRSSSC